MSGWEIRPPVSLKWLMRPMYPEEMAAEAEETEDGRSSVQLKPSRVVTPKAVSKTKLNSGRREG